MSVSTPTAEVFFYGLFMDEHLLRAQGVQQVNLRRASLRGYALRLGARATLVADREAEVFGMLGSLAREDLARLYLAPGLEDYRPEAVRVTLDGAAADTVEALCFNLPDGAAGGRNEEYAARLRALATRLGLPAGYVAGI